MTTRTLILNVLRAEAQPMTLAEIGRRVGITPQLARHHVKQLCAAGLVAHVGIEPMGVNGKHAQTFRAMVDERRPTAAPLKQQGEQQ